MNFRDIHSLDGIKMLQEGVEVETLAHHVIDGVYLKIFVARKAGTFMGQHAHEYPHGHLVAAGEVRLFIDGVEAGDFGPGDIATIQAGKKHVLLALEDNTIGACIHNTHGELEPKIAAKAIFGE